MKFILVSGPENSGKTSAIRDFATRHVFPSGSTILWQDTITPTRPIPDFICHGTVTKGSVTNKVAICSRGDDKSCIKHGFKTINSISTTPDVIVISSRGKGSTVEEIINQIRSYLDTHGYSATPIENALITITSLHFNTSAINNGATLPAYSHADSINRVAQAIYDAI